MKRRLILIGLFSPLLSARARAHSWYDQSCCSGTDCEPLEADAVTEMKGGWQVAYVGKLSGPISAFVPRGDERHSQDGRFHGCARPGRFLCLYVPSVA
jgi:hypothetical protein